MWPVEDIAPSWLEGTFAECSTALQVVGPAEPPLRSTCIISAAVVIGSRGDSLRVSNTAPQLQL